MLSYTINRYTTDWWGYAKQIVPQIHALHTILTFSQQPNIQCLHSCNEIWSHFKGYKCTHLNAYVCNCSLIQIYDCICTHLAHMQSFRWTFRYTHKHTGTRTHRCKFNKHKCNFCENLHKQQTKWIYEVNRIQRINTIRMRIRPNLNWEFVVWVRYVRM